MISKPKFGMFIDDTGDVTNSTTNAVEHRYASITGVIFERGYLAETFDPGFLQLVERHFGLTEAGKPPVLHRRQMIKPPREGPFACLADPIQREAWENACLRMMTKATYHLITVSIDKVAFYFYHPKTNLDVYEILIQNCVERYFYFLKDRGSGDVVVEAQNPGSDKAISERFRSCIENGTEHISSSKLKQAFTSNEIKIISKTEGWPALQMADLLARPCFSHCLVTYSGMTDCITPFARRVMHAVGDKFYKKDGAADANGYGTVWRPQKR